MNERTHRPQKWEKERAGKKRTLDLTELNRLFEPLPFQQRLEKIFDLYSEKEILITSSFGTKSIFLLHLLQAIKPQLTVYFVNTGFHFKETLAYKDSIAKAFDLNVVDVLPDPTQHALTLEEEWWKEHPKMCCTINKVVPLDHYIARHKIWISGLMAYQTENRSRMQVFEQKGDIIKFQPLIDIDEGEFLYHMSKHRLPRHPLEKHGYGSIGCSHCTVKGEGRSGRWKDTGKTECGLHTKFYFKDKKKS